MSSLFADTHNVVAILEKSDAAEGFEQIIDFLSGSYIYYALTVNPHIYISCIKQFWNTASVERSGDVTSQWKFLINTILQSLSAKRTSWNEFSTAMASAVICLSKENVIEDVGHDAIPSPPSPSQKPSSPPRQPHSSPQDPPHDVEFPTQLQQVLNICSALTKHVENLENDNAAQKLGRMIDDMDKDEEIELVKDADIAEFERRHATEHAEKQAEIYHIDLDHSSKVLNVVAAAASQVNAASATLLAARPSILIDDMDKDKGIELVNDAESEGRHATEQAEQHAEIYHIDLDHSSKVLSMQEDDSKVQEVVKVVTTAKLITEVVTATASQVSAASATIPAAAPTVVAAYTRRRK
nr:hypothetical protein [Tanacetum cinerariifolium]